MDAQTTERVIEILETDPDFFVPIKKLWLLLQGEGLALGSTLQDFQQELREDSRFEFTPGIDHTESFKDDAELAKEMEVEMESLGFFSGPRVKLLAREMTAEDIFAGLARSLERMNEALQSAWDTRPPEDQETADQLLEILAAGQKLEKEVRELIDTQDPEEE